MLKDRQIRTTEFKEDRVNSFGMALNGVLKGPRGQCQTVSSSSHSTAGPGVSKEQWRGLSFLWFQEGVLLLAVLCGVGLNL